MEARAGRLLPGAACLASIVVLTSCATGQDEAAATTADRLLSAVAQQRGDDACRLLSPAARSDLEDSSGRACDEAVLEEDLGTGKSRVGVQVFDTMAQVRFADETVFLSRFDGAWLVVATACSPRAGRPYDCDISAS